MWEPDAASNSLQGCPGTGAARQVLAAPEVRVRTKWEKHKGRIQLRGRQHGLLPRGSGVLREGSGGRVGKRKEREMVSATLGDIRARP